MAFEVALFFTFEISLHTKDVRTSTYGPKMLQDSQWVLEKTKLLLR